MRRRDFLTGLVGAVPAAAFSASAETSTIRTVGYLSSGTSAGFTPFLTAFRQGLSETGYVEGRNLKIEYRWAGGEEDQLPALAADLISRRVAVIAATGGLHPAVVAKAGTSSIPIVFTGGGDPVKFGLVASLARPGGNATGAVNFSPAATAKRLEILRQLLPAGATIALLANPNAPNNESQTIEFEEAARAIGQSTFTVKATSEEDFEPAFAEIVRLRASAVFVMADPLFTSRRTRLIALAAEHGLPASYAFRDFPLAGGLMSYGADLVDVHRQAGIYTGRILNGAKPTDLPVLQPVKFDLVLNLKTAKALDLNIPANLLALADQVIE